MDEVGQEITMKMFREILKEADPTLYLALENSWKIAREEWIPMLKMDSESHSGLPHLESVERWMDKIAEACRPIWSQHSASPFGFNPLEVYMALCAALFHDVGRGRKTADHGKTSREILDSNWAQLGVVSGRVAYELGHICEFHTSNNKWTKHDTVKIHPWGIVHTEAIASLLTLADELDTAYTRAAPQYMKEPELLFDLFGDEQRVELDKMESMADDYFSKGLYRDFISDVDLDPSSHLIKTVLFSDRLPGKLCLSHTTSKSADWLRCIKKNADDIAVFSPEDYFFRYLEHLRPTVHSEVLEFHTNQFYKALNFKRAELMHKLRIPSEYKDNENLLYNIQLWDRQMTGMSRSARDKVQQETKNLKNTVELIENTIEQVDKEIERSVNTQRSGKNVIVNFTGMKELIEDVGGFLFYLEKRRRIIDNEAQKGQHATRNDLASLEKDWEKRDQDMVSEKEPNNQTKERLKSVTRAIESMKEINNNYESTNKAHALLIDLMHYLTYVDLQNMIYFENALVREWESWTVNDFHTNLLLAFHIYLANVRKLFKDENDLDYRYQGEGKVERPFIDKQPRECKKVTLFTGVIGTSQIVDKADQGKHEDARKSLKDELNGYLKRCSGHGSKHSMFAPDFRFSVKLIFMQWLSGDVATKNKQLERILPGLQKLEIPFNEWLIEYNNHLFDKEWKLSLEPSLKCKHIEDTAEKVFELSKNLHIDEDGISWDTLAAALRDPKMERVKTGAVRLSNLLRIFSGLNNEKSDEKSDVESGKNKSRILGFEHLLLSELNDAELDGERRMSLETSYSSWQLKRDKGIEKSSVARVIEFHDVKKFLAGLRES